MNQRFGEEEAVGAINSISQEQCLEMLRSQPVGRVAWQAGGGPEILPVNYVCTRTG